MDVNTSQDILRIHPRAQAAYDCVAAVLPATPIGVARAVRRDGEVWVFAGFAGVGIEGAVKPAIEPGLTDAEIEEASWAEVGAIWKLMTAPPAAQRAIADTLAATAPADVLRHLGLPDSGDAMRARKSLRLGSRDRADPETEEIFARRKLLYEAQRVFGTSRT